MDRLFSQSRRGFLGMIASALASLPFIGRVFAGGTRRLPADDPGLMLTINGRKAGKCYGSRVEIASTLGDDLVTHFFARLDGDAWDVLRAEIDAAPAAGGYSFPTVELIVGRVELWCCVPIGGATDPSGETQFRCVPDRKRGDGEGMFQTGRITNLHRDVVLRAGESMRVYT